MANVVSKDGKTYFGTELVSEMFSLVKGHSALVKLSDQKPIPFVGNDIMTFSLDGEVAIVGENEAKSNGGSTIGTVSIMPIKFEYGTRVSDEFLYAAEEKKLNYLEAFMEGFAKKIARGLDIAALHGVNPRTGNASAIVGTNNFDSQITAERTVNLGTNPTVDGDLEEAVQKITDNDGTVSGIAIAPVFASAMGKILNNNMPVYPEFRFGGNPDSFMGLGSDVNTTVSFNNSKDRAFVGDFKNAFKWGYAEEIPLEVIEFGCPDNDQTAGDLKGHNQVYLRSEAYIGWGILDSKSFAKVAVANG